MLANTEDWLGGVVPAGELGAVLDRVESALQAVRDPKSGLAVFTDFFRPGDASAPPGIGGPAGGDLYFDLAVGYRPVHSLSAPLVRRVDVPYGYHGFLPTRPDMLAVFIARGPDLPAGGRLNTIRAIDVAPAVAAILGIDPPSHAAGQSLLELLESGAPAAVP